MDSSDEEVLLESCCFLLNYHQEQIKRKRKKTWVREIFKKRIGQGVYIIYCRRCVSVIENRVSGYLYNERFSESNEKNVRPFKVWPGPVLFIKILLKTTQLPSKHFPSGLSLCILYFLFHKSKDTSAIPQPSVQYLVYIFPICFRFHKCFNNFHLSKNILINKFFSETSVSS